MNLIFNAPINNLSFGNVSYNVLREFYKQDDKVVIFPIGGNTDFAAFDKIDQDFKSWIWVRSRLKQPQQIPGHKRRFVRTCS